MFLSAGKEFCLLHFLPLDHLPQLRHGCPAVLFKQATSVETRQHDNKEGCDVEEEEAGEEGAEPGK